MPSGRVHAAVTLTILTTIGVVVSRPWTDEELILLATGTATGLILGPDLDVDAGNISSSFFRKVPVVGPVLSGLWEIFWMPYSRTIPHRHWLSHAPVISTAIRLLYVYGWLVIILKCLGSAPPPTDWHALGCVFLGLVLSDSSHWACDMAGKEIHGGRRNQIPSPWFRKR